MAKTKIEDISKTEEMNKAEQHAIKGGVTRAETLERLETDKLAASRRRVVAAPVLAARPDATLSKEELLARMKK